LEVLDYVADKRPKPKRKRKAGSPGKPDPTKRQKVEQAAEAVVWEYYERFGYELEDVTDEHVGWDFNATKGKLRLRIEVKGLSGHAISVEVTPNEYANMTRHKDTYRLCVVTEALGKAELSVFSYSVEAGCWKEQSDNRTLAIEQIVAARCTAD